MDLVLEDVARDLLLVMKENLNDVVDEVWAEMAIADAAYYAQLSQPVPVTPKPYPASFYLGHHPAILDHPLTDYPNVTTVSYEANSADDVGDQYEVTENRAYVEVFVVHKDESTINRLAWRYARAVTRVISRYKDLSDGQIEPIQGVPAVMVSNAAARRVDEFTDETIYIQGCRLEHLFRATTLW
jgi:hypothetical protein